MSGKELIEKIGSELYDDFSISTEPYLSIYKKTYEWFSERVRNRPRQKGLMLVGPIGVGKSAMIRIMQKIFLNTDAQIVRLNAQDLILMAEECSVSEILLNYGKSLKNDLCIDDFGVGESEGKRYGNTINVISTLILDRYELFLQTGHVTHITTNKPLTIDKKKYPDIVTLQDMYGDRVVDRLNEMNETIVWKGKSLRTYATQTKK